MREDQEREDWCTYFMDLANKAASRSTCLRRKVGAVAVDGNNRIIGTGYNGVPTRMKHCTGESCVRIKNNIPSGTQLDICRAVHAEANIVAYCGKELIDATIYCTTKPCISCFKLLVAAGVTKIYWQNHYEDPFMDALMAEIGQTHSVVASDGNEFTYWCKFYKTYN